MKFVAPFVHDDPIRLVAPALVTFLPGATLTIATIELASDQIVSGASRLVWGVSQLLLLAFGVFIGLSLVGTVDACGAQQVGAWAPWVGVVPGRHRLHAVRQRARRVRCSSSGSRCSRRTRAQVLGAALLDPSLSGFVGGLVIVPLTYALARFREARRPPSCCSRRSGCCCPVPSVSAACPAWPPVRPAARRTWSLTGITIFAVALGVLVGTSVTRDASAVHRTWKIRFRP